MEWQPIQTAPKDGTEILAGQAGTRKVGVIVWNIEIERWSAPAEHWDEPSWLPTHWMPLPEPPKE